ncbi:MAG: 2,3,4,5-tetrahydropyridine-2,6-dicarboxylate N-succinyltransferase [Bdellovibrionaceae bacterium]|nr:2,3,4,5-tetrahydropyridine-2,6-dicarboxylate N-succinyltransferase [Pseudobdellovibrionaceae bacterium]
MTQDPRQAKIEALVQDLAQGHPFTPEREDLVESVISDLNRGVLRVCEKIDNEWVTNAWIKQTILFYFRLKQMDVMSAGDFNYYDKIPVKHWTGDEGVRVVPPAVARYGSFVEKGAILMPSYVNVGAYVGAGTMVDTWATVGSCAQIGKNVHLSGGVGIGGVLEPVQASPVIIEDDVFIGSRCIVVEGVVVEQGAVLGAGVTITASTKIVDVTGDEEKSWKGRVPAQAVVIPGTLTKAFPAGTYGVPCALLIGYRTASTDKKTSLNNALRDFQVSV